MLNQNQFIIGQFRPGRSLIHTLDPRTKVLMVAAIMIAAILKLSLFFYLILIAMLFALLLGSGLSMSMLLRNLRPIIYFVLFTAVFHFIFSGRSDPHTVFELGPLRLTETAVSLAATYSARIVLFVLATFMITLTTSPLSIAEALIALLKPLWYLKVPVYDIGMILFIALRFIPVLAGEIEMIRKAQMIRGVDFSGGMITRVRRAVALVLPVFFSAFRRAEDLSVAIETRGYRSGHPRTSLYPLRFQRTDYVFLVLTIVSLGFYIVGTIAP